MIKNLERIIVIILVFFIYIGNNRYYKMIFFKYINFHFLHELSAIKDKLFVQFFSKYKEINKIHLRN